MLFGRHEQKCFRIQLVRSHKIFPSNLEISYANDIAILQKLFANKVVFSSSSSVLKTTKSCQY